MTQTAHFLAHEPVSQILREAALEPQPEPLPCGATLLQACSKGFRRHQF